AALEARYAIGRRVAVRLVVMLHADTPIVRCILEIENSAPWHRLRARTPTGLGGAAAVAGTAFGNIARAPLSSQAAGYALETPVATAPAHRFVAAAMGRRGLALLARGAPPAARRTVAAQRGARDRRARHDGVDVGRPPRVRGGPLARGPPVRRGRAGARGVTQSRAGAPHPAQRAHSGHRRGGARRRQRDHARGGPLVPRPRRATTYTIMGQHDRFRPGHARQRTLGRHGAGRRARAGRGRMHAAGPRSARRAPASQDPPMTRRRLATACALTALLAPLARFAPRGAA